MIFGFAVTAGFAGKLLDPYSPTRLVLVTAAVCCLAFMLALVAIYKLEDGTSVAQLPDAHAASKPTFRAALLQVWAEPAARQFSIFVFISMLAFSAQDLILEPFAGTVFGFTPGQSTQLSGLQHGGVLLGMILVALAGVLGARWGHQSALRHVGSLRGWTVGGCVASAVALAGLSVAGFTGPTWPLNATVFALGVANGAFSIGAISSMMRLAGQGADAREGVRMGLWGAAQAIAFGLGGLLGTAASDLARWLIASPGAAYASVFAFEALLFVLSAALAWQVGKPEQQAVPVAKRQSIPFSLASHL
jgi:BCD family chlorophyll transporter-like MFS transporter